MIRKINSIVIYFTIIYLYYISFIDFYFSIDNQIYRELFAVFAEGTLILIGGLLLGKLIGVLGFATFEYLVYIIVDPTLILVRLLSVGFWVAVYLLWKHLGWKGFIAGLLFHLSWNISVEFLITYLFMINIIITTVIILYVSDEDLINKN